MTPQITRQTIKKYDAILARGLCCGVGNPKGQMCIEAAVCAALDLPHGDDPKCVAASVRQYKIKLNDSRWSSSTARAAGLRDLGIAQIGSLGVVDDQAFTTRLAELTTRILIPTLFREVLSNNSACLAAADECEKSGDAKSARAAADVAAAAYTYVAAAAAAAADAAAAAAAAAAAVETKDDKYLMLSAKLALQVLTELKSPGVEWLNA